MRTRTLKAGAIEPVSCSGLVESLSKIALVCSTAGEVRDDLTKEDLLNFLAQIAELSAEALELSGATREEIAHTHHYLRQGMVLGRQRTN